MRIVDDINAGAVVGVRRFDDPHGVGCFAENKSASKHGGTSQPRIAPYTGWTGFVVRIVIFVVKIAILFV